MLKKTDLDSFRRQLLNLMDQKDRERHLLREVSLRSAGGEASGGISNVPLHLGDLGSEEAEEVAGLRLVENKERLMKEISEALDRIEQGSFGSCEICQREISRERLKVLPYTRYCVSCATSLEEEA